MPIMGILASAISGNLTPTAPVAGYTAWYDASDTATITLSGSDVTQWNDKSANGYNLTQPNSGFRPQSGTRTINSLNVIDYNANTDTLVASTAANWTFFSNSAGSTVFLVISLDVLDNYIMLRTMGGSNATVGASFNISSGTYKGQQVIANGSTFFCLNASTSSISATTPTIWVSKSDPNNATAADKNSIYKNSGTAEKNNTTTGSASASAPAQPLRVGDYEEAGTLAPNGVYGEVIFYNTQLSDGDIALNVSYLSNKWGI